MPGVVWAPVAGLFGGNRLLEDQQDRYRSAPCPRTRCSSISAGSSTRMSFAGPAGPGISRRCREPFVCLAGDAKSRRPANVRHRRERDLAWAGRRRLAALVSISTAPTSRNGSSSSAAFILSTVGRSDFGSGAALAALSDVELERWSVGRDPRADFFVRYTAMPTSTVPSGAPGGSLRRLGSAGHLRRTPEHGNCLRHQEPVDRDPPFSNQSSLGQVMYDPRYADPRGRVFYAQLSMAFR